MNKFTNPLDNIKIASPCSADWEAMIGNERSRHCGDCKLNVYNLSEMTKREAENFLLEAEGRVCVRYFKRADGTVLTKDCPVGWKAIKCRVSKTATAFASLVFAAFSGIGLASYFTKAEIENHTMGTITPVVENSTMGEIAIDENSNTAFQGAPEAIIGKIGYAPTLANQIKTPNYQKTSSLIFDKITLPRPNAIILRSFQTDIEFDIFILREISFRIILHEILRLQFVGKLTKYFY